MKVFSAALILAAVSAISLDGPGEGPSGPGSKPRKPKSCADQVFDQVWGLMDQNGDANLCQAEFDMALDFAE